MSTHAQMKAGLVVASVLALSGLAQAATTGTGTVTADVGQLVEITVPDNSIAAFPEFTPAAGSETVKYSTSDKLQFSNAKSNIQALWGYSAAVSFTKDADGAVSTTTVQYQGTTTTLADLVYGTQSATGNFVPLTVVTATDLTSEGNTGWTTHASCASMTYQGSLSIPYYDSAGLTQTALTRYYRYCDSAELYLSASKDVSAGDLARIVSDPEPGVSATAGEYEVAIAGQDYILYSAASATTVTLRLGQHVGLGTSATTGDFYSLLKFPDGFPAGAFSVTVTGTTSDIVS